MSWPKALNTIWLSIIMYTHLTHGVLDYTLDWTVPASGGITYFAGQLTVPDFQRSGGFLFAANLAQGSTARLINNLAVVNTTWSLWTHWDEHVGPSGRVQNSVTASHELQIGPKVEAAFEMTQFGSGWSVTTWRTKEPGSKMTTYFNADKPMTDVIFQIFIVYGTWDFGPLEFDQVVMRAKTNDVNWCSKSPGGAGTIFQQTKLVSKTSNGETTCTMSKLTMVGPGVGPGTS